MSWACRSAKWFAPSRPCADYNYSRKILRSHSLFTIALLIRHNIFAEKKGWMITERLMQFIWQFQYFQALGLETTVGEPVTVLHPGVLNKDQGPDFSNARIRIGAAVWVGNVELHLRALDWKRHTHDNDPNYAHVILHVVWFDGPCSDLACPTVTLEHRIPGLLLRQYFDWMRSDRFIPCGSGIGSVNELVWAAWRERLVVERLEAKCFSIAAMLERTRGHWDEVCWQIIARQFGGPVNSHAFEEIARSLPLNLLWRHRHQIHHLEAFLLGQANLLSADLDDHYFVMLKKEYAFLQAKFALRPADTAVHFLRMRPPGFPTVRLAQLAVLCHDMQHLCSRWLNASSVAELGRWLTVTANDYWHYHYTFSHTGNFLPKIVGKQLVDTVMINAVIPVVFAYGREHHDASLVEKALTWLNEIAAESNVIVRGFARCGVRARTAADSQALLRLKSHYCDVRRCLDCAVGNAILKR